MIVYFGVEDNIHEYVQYTAKVNDGLLESTVD